MMDRYFRIFCNILNQNFWCTIFYTGQGRPHISWESSLQKKCNVTDFLQRGRNKAGGWTGGGAWLYQASISNFRTIKHTNKTKQWKYNNNKKQNKSANGNIITDTASPVFLWNLQDKLAKVLSQSPGGVLIVNWLTILSFEFLTI